MRRSPRTTVRLTSAIAAMALGLIGLTACSSDDDGGTSDDVSSDEPCGTSEDTTLTVGLFGTFGFKENGLYDEYKKVCPNITVKEDVVTQSADYWTRLKTRLASGSGLADVQAIEIGFVADVVQNHSEQFVNLNDVAGGRSDIKAQFYDWKWQQASSPDGQDHRRARHRHRPEAICYRSDLLEEAGYSADPDELAKEWTTWDDFIDFGKEYKAQKSGKAFVDSAASIFSTAVYQGDEAYNDAEGQPNVEDSDGVQTAWGYATQAAQDGITAGLPQFSDPWNKAFCQRRVRRHRLPHLDDGLHPGPGRAGRRRQVERRAGPPRWRHELGRLLARRTGRGAEQGRGDRAGEVAVRQGPAGHDVDVEGPGRPLPVQPGRGRGPGGQERHERVLQ